MTQVCRQKVAINVKDTKTLDDVKYAQQLLTSTTPHRKKITASKKTKRCLWTNKNDVLLSAEVNLPKKFNN
jgi:hypothetical protein